MYLNITIIDFNGFYYISLNTTAQNGLNLWNLHIQNIITQNFVNVNVKFKWNVKYCKVLHDTTCAGVWIW